MTSQEQQLVRALARAILCLRHQNHPKFSYIPYSSFLDGVTLWVMLSWDEETVTFQFYRSGGSQGVILLDSAS